MGNSSWLTAAWWATVKVVVTACVGVPAPVPTSAWTLTRSPGTNGRVGRKLSPVPVEYACRRPGCTPERDPTTRTFATCVPVPPRKLIWVAGEASGVPGSGETVTALAAAAATAALSSNATDAEEAASPQEESATASSAAVSRGSARLNARAPRGGRPGSALGGGRRGSAPREGRRGPPPPGGRL